MYLVLFAVSKILDSSESASCLLEMGVEYWYASERDCCWEGRGATARPREVILLSICCVYVCIYMLGSLSRATNCSVVSASMLAVSHAAEVIVPGLLVVVYKIPYTSCIFNTAVVVACQIYSNLLMLSRCRGY